MRSDDLFAFLATYSLMSLAILIFGFATRRTWTSAIGILTALTALVGATVLGFHVEPATSAVDLLMRIVSEHRPRNLVAMAMGASAALAWVAHSLHLVSLEIGGREPGEPNPPALFRPARLLSMEQMLIALSVAGVTGSAGLLFWNTLFDLKAESQTKALETEFVIDPIAEISFLPTRLAVDESGNVLVSYFWAKNDATHGGGIIKLTEDPETGLFGQETVADLELLFRTTGLVARNGDLYVSRSGYHARAEKGKLFYEDTGAVTQLKDLNGDGYFEYYHDILTGIPGARGPHIQHQNNGIAFAPDGSLFVTNGVAGIALDEHPLGGALLKLTPDFKSFEVFATGFRNPFGIAVNNVGEVFVTDNDVEENPGDELDHVIKGEHYGHPFVYPNHPGKSPVGFRDPILLGHAPRSNYVGMAYTDSPMLPDEFRDCLYIADLSMGEVVRVKLERAGDTYRVAEFALFASIPTPVDIAIAKNGTIYVASRYDQKVFRIRHRGSIHARNGSS